MTISLQSIAYGGDDWVVARYDSGDAGALSAALQAAAETCRATGDWLEVVPGIVDLTLKFDPLSLDPEKALQRAEAALATLLDPAGAALETIEIPVAYGGHYGPDLAACAQKLGLSEADIIERHTGTPLIVQMMGFAPGFAYLGETDEKLAADRLDEPRRRVEAGSVGIVGRQSCLYSLAGPGGWPLIGRTPLTLFDPQAEDPFLLKPGAEIRFVAIDEAAFERLKGGA